MSFNQHCCNRCCFCCCPRKDCEHHEEPTFIQHVHEFNGSTRLAEMGEDAHNHRFAGVSGRALPFHGSHVHEIETSTDSIDHRHFIREVSGIAKPVGGGRHVHFVNGNTTFVDQHRHQFIVATLIENPIGTNIT